MKKNINDFSKRLKLISEKKGLSIPAIAEELNLNRQVVYNWFTARNFPHPETLIKLAAVLSVPAPWLLYGINDMSNEPIEHKKTPAAEHIQTLENLLYILESNELVFINAIIQCLNAFYTAIETKKNLENIIKNQNSNFNELVGMIKDLERKIDEDV